VWNAAGRVVGGMLNALVVLLLAAGAAWGAWLLVRSDEPPRDLPAPLDREPRDEHRPS